jgi:hypothetical protein
MKKNKWVHGFIISTKVGLYLIVSIISTIHVINFFELSNPSWLAISLAVAFEVGAAASLASIIILEKTNRTLVWMLFILLTAMQMMGNTYYAFTNLHDFKSWSELFGLVEEDVIFQKRILSLISGALLPIIALGFIKSLVDYVKPPEENEKNPPAYEYPKHPSNSKETIEINEEKEETQEESSKKKVESVAEEFKIIPFEEKVERIIQEENPITSPQDPIEPEHKKKIKEIEPVLFFNKKPIKITEKNSPTIITDERKEKIRKQESDGKKG